MLEWKEAVRRELVLWRSLMATFCYMNKWIHRIHYSAITMRKKMLSGRKWHMYSFTDQHVRDFRAHSAEVYVPALKVVFYAPLPLYWFCWLRPSQILLIFSLKKGEWFFNTVIKLCERIPKLLDWLDGLFSEALYLGKDACVLVSIKQERTVASWVLLFVSSLSVKYVISTTFCDLT